MDQVYCYILMILGCMMIFYAFARAIDFLFTKQDDKRRCKMAKGLVKYSCKKASGMSIDMVKQINKNLFDMTRDFEGQ